MMEGNACKNSLGSRIFELPEYRQFSACRFALSARNYYKIIKVARTIADLTGEREIAALHVAEAFQYRPKE